MNLNRAKPPKKNALGKGFHSLLGIESEESVEDSNDESPTPKHPSYSSAEENASEALPRSNATTSKAGASSLQELKERALTKTPEINQDKPESVSPVHNVGNFLTSTSKKLNAVLELPVNAVIPNPQQPRKLFRQEELESLVASIKQDGVISPIIVSRDKSSNQYVLIAGERRLRASKLAGKTTIPAILKELHDEEILRVALIENIQRADLTVIEEAKAYQSLIEEYGLTQEKVSAQVGKDRTTVTNAIRMLSLPTEVQNDLLQKRISMGHGRALLGLTDKKEILRARDVVISKCLSVRQTESLCKRVKKGPENKKNNTSGSAMGHLEQLGQVDLEHLADNLRSHLRTKVKISGSGSKGKVEISYYSAAELERIMKSMGATSV